MPVALLSVYDKTGVAELARGLVECGWEIWSSGGTAQAVRAAGVDVVDVADITGYPPLLGHRVATLHPLVHGGILGDIDQAEHRRDMDEHGIRPISLVAVNFYPFSADPGIEMIDVGGPAMARAAAKNHSRVTVVVRPGDYERVLEEIRTIGEVRDSTRRELAVTAFRTCALYDASISNWLTRDESISESDTPSDAEAHPELPDVAVLGLERVETLRYGENPHQVGARYRIAGQSSWWDGVAQHGGKGLSYLNVYDADAAWSLVHRFESPACVIVKHANPCGVAVLAHAPIAEVYSRAHDCDPVSAFGGIVAVNRQVTADMAVRLVEVFTEVVIAPDYEPDALDILRSKANMRILSGQPPAHRDRSLHNMDMRTVGGSLLVQTPDRVEIDRESWEVVTQKRPRDDQWADIEVAWQVVAAVSSNAIVLVGGGCAVGIGAGQQNRLDSARIAVERAAGRAHGGVCASDAFFPFRDGLDAVVAAGVSVVVQPGGSVRDREVVEAADEHGIAMLITGRRHFRH